MAKNFQNLPRKKVAEAQATLQEALALHQKGQLAQAQVLYESVLKIQPRNFACLHLLGVLSYQAKRSQTAIELISKAIAINPKLAAPYSNIGMVFQSLNRLDEALLNYDKAIALKPDYAEAYYNRGNALKSLQRLDEALSSYDKAIALVPYYFAAHNNRGNALRDLKRLSEALVSYDKAIALNADYFEAYYNRGQALKELRRLEEALASYDKAITLKSDYAEAHYNRAAILMKLNRLEEALISYDKTIALQPDCEFLFGDRLYAKMMICDWQCLNKNLENYAANVRAAKKITAPLPALSLLDSPEIHQQATKIFVDTKYPYSEHLGAIQQRLKGKKICIGYYSADFRNHPITYLMAELFETHSRDRFEIYGFSFGPNTNDDMRRRVSSAFDKFIDINNLSDEAVAKLSRELGIDIAVDLGGHTRDQRTGIFAMRCAPVQVNYLGYPGTMGANYIDYVIADKTVIPVESQSHFTEKIAYLPHSFQVNDSTRKISDRVFTKHELGLPEIGFVFCCFNNNCKILPSTFDIWMRVLKAVEGSVLWLLEVENNPSAAENLRKEAELRGVDSSRLVFAKRMPYIDYLARYRCADLFLDTLPYNAGTTASDALWAGLPVLTCMGKSFASRMASSLLSVIDLPELIASSEAEYEAKAVELVSNSEKLSEIKVKLVKNKLTTPLFNTKLFTKHIETAYASMYDRYHAGLAPESFDVEVCD